LRENSLSVNCTIHSCPFVTSYREQVDKVAKLRDETARAILKSSSEIAMFKEEVSQQLQYLKEFAETN